MHGRRGAYPGWSVRRTRKGHVTIIKRKPFVTAVVLALIAAAICSSSKASGSDPASGDPTYTVGVLTDLTGFGGTIDASTPLGVEAGVGVAAKEGFNIHYVIADTGSSPVGALAAAHQLVDQYGVFAVIGNSSVLYAAAPYLASKGVPVIGGAENATESTSGEDATEWLSDPNMFSVSGTQDFTKVESTEGLFFKRLGATSLGTIGYRFSPSSTEAARADAMSARAAGIKVGYLYILPFGLNSESIALAMKRAKVNGFITSIDTNGSIALITALRQLDVPLKGMLLATGYGGDLKEGGPGTEQIVQGVYFESPYEPIEMRTAATRSFRDALKTYAGFTGDPTLGEYIGYLSVNALVAGLEAAGPHPTQATFIEAMLGMRHYDAAGLFGGHSIGFAMNQRGKAVGADNCVWVTRFSGSSFHLVRRADPICGKVIPGKVVSPRGRVGSSS
jgi:branched-chain amino acid transport system substrate-binding protein